MDDPDLEAWTLCWKVNLAFHKAIKKGHWKCIVCRKEQEDSKIIFRSEFGQQAVACSAGHCNDYWFWSNGLAGPCHECDPDLVLNISKRKQKCFVEHCHRILNVNEQVVKDWLGPGPLLEKYLIFLEKYKTFECIICNDELPLRYAPSRSPTTKCNHDPACDPMPCLRKYVETCVKGRGWQNIVCPHPGCESTLNARDVGEWVAPEAFKSYNKQLLLRSLSKEPKFRWCYKECGHGQIHLAGENQPEWRCKKCKALNCFKCQLEGHPGRKCEQHAKLRDYDEANEKQLAQTSKRCPKSGCGLRIRKLRFKSVISDYFLGGCGTRFCWKCKVIFERIREGDYRYQHLAECPAKDGIAGLDIPDPVPRPEPNSRVYREGWDLDPEYIEGNSEVDSEDDSAGRNFN
ncbi:hypothetical protein AOQ84DRAFT_420999 [Glonium stellatum]|uniref:RBR-type E3 ubiquitin transferase n=1 Tax=Glonium stellatum TaxID=574774 RepID=A0A8E2EQC1_9PEZI|nr:hypothetical protein AOQ84DRAFT_420999 [Glonium stellatum]